MLYRYIGRSPIFTIKLNSTTHVGKYTVRPMDWMLQDDKILGSLWTPKPMKHEGFKP